MTASKAELEIVKQLFSTLSDDDKKSFLKSIKSKEKLEPNFIFSKEIKECPHCKSTHFVKNGKKDGKQRFVCMDCHKTFTITNNTILFVVNLNGKSVAKIANLGKPNIASLSKVIQGKVERESVFVTDSLRSYLKLSNEMNLNHIRIPRNKHSNGSFNIQVVNNYHSRLKSMLVYNFKGVSTKYLNNYLVYHNFVNFAKETRIEKEQILLNHILNTDCISQSISVANRPAVPLLVV